MKTFLRSTIPLAASVLLMTCLPHANAQQGHFYVKGDVGGAITLKTELREFFGPVAPNSKVKFDPGARLGLKGGYWITDWFSAEVETGFIANRIDSVTGATENDASLVNVPLLVNANFQWPHIGKFTPFFGGGLGGSTTVLSARELTIGGTELDGSVSDTVFAYQAFGGVRYALNERMGISVEYHYFATTSSNMRADVTSGTATRNLRLAGTESHTFTAAFDFRF